MYTAYCAVCHGQDGKGNGPATEALKVPPPELTVLAQKNGGKYLSMRVASIIRGEAALPANGTKEMPVIAFLEHEPGLPGGSAAAHCKCKSERVHRVAAGEVKNRFITETQRYRVRRPVIFSCDSVSLWLNVINFILFF
jgi:Cytochrome c